MGPRWSRGWRTQCLSCMRPTNPGDLSVTASYPWPVLASVTQALLPVRFAWEASASGTGRSACATLGECLAIGLFAVIGSGHENDTPPLIDLVKEAPIAHPVAPSRRVPIFQSLDIRTGVRGLAKNRVNIITQLGFEPTLCNASRTGERAAVSPRGRIHWFGLRRLIRRLTDCALDTGETFGRARGRRNPMPCRRHPRTLAAVRQARGSAGPALRSRGFSTSLSDFFFGPDKDKKSGRAAAPKGACYPLYFQSENNTPREY